MWSLRCRQTSGSGRPTPCRPGRASATSGSRRRAVPAVTTAGRAAGRRRAARPPGSERRPGAGCRSGPGRGARRAARTAESGRAGRRPERIEQAEARRRPVHGRRHRAGLASPSSSSGLRSVRGEHRDTGTGRSGTWQSAPVGPGLALCSGIAPSNLPIERMFLRCHGRDTRAPTIALRHQLGPGAAPSGGQSRVWPPSENRSRFADAHGRANRCSILGPGVGGQDGQHAAW